MTDKIVRPTNETIPHHINGIVVVFDLMNVLVARWHAGEKTRIHAVRSTLDTVRLIALQYQPSLIVFAGEGGHGHRHAIYPEYKANRPETDPGLRDQIALCLKALEAIGWPVLTSPSFEADDVLATLATDLAKRADGVVIVTSDKDLLSFVSHDNVTVHDPAKKVRVTRDMVRERFGIAPQQVTDFLTLQGDSTDNIPGGQGIGPKTAAELLTVVGNLNAILKLAADPTPSHPQAKALAKVQRSRDAILLSQQLVTLITTVPLPTRWWLWPADQPRPHWQLKLQELGLGEPAGRLADCGLFNELRSQHVPLLPPIPTTEIDHAEADQGLAVPSDFESTPTPVRASSTVDGGREPTSHGGGSDESNAQSERDDRTALAQRERVPSITERDLSRELEGNRSTGCVGDAVGNHTGDHISSSVAEQPATATSTHGPSSTSRPAALTATEPPYHDRQGVANAATDEPLPHGRGTDQPTRSISEAELRREHAAGLAWRAREPGIVSRMKATTAAAYCREFWDSTEPTDQLLAFARGAIGEPFKVEQVTRPATNQPKAGHENYPTKTLF